MIEIWWATRDSLPNRIRWGGGGGEFKAAVNDADLHIKREDVGNYRTKGKKAGCVKKTAKKPLHKRLKKGDWGGDESRSLGGERRVT